MYKTKLYTKDSNDNIRFWSIETDGATIRQESGVVGTDSPVIHEKKATAKHVGKSNERSAEEQAISMAESKVKQKKRKGYFETKEEAENTEVVEPMLAKSYDTHAKKIEWNQIGSSVHVQPKLDGMRCLLIADGGTVKMVSRGNKEILTMDHIKAPFETLNRKMIFDGELYAHGLSFQENMKLIKKYRRNKSERVRFHIYDMVSEANYDFRYEMLSRIVRGFNYDPLSHIETIRVTSHEEMVEMHKQFLVQGYEGTIIRHSERGYEMKRTDQLLKYKQFIDKSYMVVDVIPSQARPDHGIVVCTTAEEEDHAGQIFKASLKGSHDERKKLLSNKEQFVGETAEIRYFEKTDDGLPRFPVCVGFRLDK